jgi:serine kinase of HPr protein (carbohydrate metabolism regulator)
MHIAELSSLLDAVCIQDGYEDREITSGYTSDLLSDVMANARESSVLVTIQAHKNTIAVATLTDVGAVVICNSRPVPEDMIEAARKEGIALFTTRRNQFVTSGILYNALTREDAAAVAT